MRRYKPIRRRRGSAYILAITTLLVGVTFALAMLRAGGANFTAEDSRQKKRAAENLAEAGIDYAFWQVHYNNKALPYTADVNLDTGSFHVEATDDGNRDKSTMLITSTGTCGSHSHTAKRVMLGLLPYHYAYCENRSIDDADQLISNDLFRGMRANGTAKLDHYFNNITTGLWVSGATITNRGTVTPQYANCPQVLFPDIDYSYYNSIATNKYWGDTWFSGFNPSSGSAVVYVSGRANVQGYYRGIITVVATSDINVIGSLLPADQNSFMVLITTQHIRVQAGCFNVQAAMYAHKPDKTATAEVSGLTTITGIWASDDNRTTTTTYFERDSRINLDIMKRLHLPGL